MEKRIVVQLDDDEMGFIKFMAKTDGITVQQEMRQMFQTELWEMMQLDYYEEYIQEAGK